MEQLQYLNKIAFYGNKNLLRNKENKIKTVIKQIVADNDLFLNTLEFNFVTDADILKINKESLNHDYYTDIITFDYADGKLITGDIYISIDRVKENAIGFQVSALDELLRVIFHGVLHLSGYKDKTKLDKSKMTELENKYLNLFKSSTGNIFKKAHSNKKQ